MKQEMDIKLYKFEIIRGKEAVAEEWLNFLSSNRKAGEALLKKERAYLEAYFTAVEYGNMYVYMFFACEDEKFSVDKAINHGSDLDEKHFEYMKECIDLTKGNIMDCLLYLDNMEDAIKDH